MASTDQFLPVDSEQHDCKQPKDPEKGMQALSVIEPPVDAPEPLMDRIEARLPGATRTQKWTTVGIGAALLFLLSALGWRTFASKHKGPCPDGYEEVGKSSGRRLMDKGPDCIQIQAHVNLLRKSQPQRTKSVAHNFQAQTGAFGKIPRKQPLPAAARGSSAYFVRQVNANGQTQQVRGLTPTRSSSLAFSPYQSFDSTQAATTFNSDKSGMYQTQASQYFSVQGGPHQVVQETGRFPDLASNQQYIDKLGSTQVSDPKSIHKLALTQAQADLRARLKEWSLRKHVNNDLFQVELEYWSKRQMILNGQMEAVLELETKFNTEKVQTNRERMRDAFTNAQQMLREDGFDAVFSEKILKRFQKSQQWEVVLFARATLATLWAVHAAAGDSPVDQTSKIQDAQSLVFDLSFDTVDSQSLSYVLSDTARSSKVGSPYLQSDQVQVEKLSAQIEKCSTLEECAKVWENQEWQQLPVDKVGIRQYYAVLQQWQARMYEAILAHLHFRDIKRITKSSN